MYGVYSLFKYQVGPFKLDTVLYTWIGKEGAEGSRDEGKPPLYSQVWSHLWVQESLAPLPLQNLLVVKHMPMIVRQRQKYPRKFKATMVNIASSVSVKTAWPGPCFRTKNQKQKVLSLISFVLFFWDFFYSTISLVYSLNLLFSSFYEQWQV